MSETNFILDVPTAVALKAEISGSIPSSWTVRCLPVIMLIKNKLQSNLTCLAKFPSVCGQQSKAQT